MPLTWLRIRLDIMEEGLGRLLSKLWGSSLRKRWQGMAKLRHSLTIDGGRIRASTSDVSLQRDTKFSQIIPNSLFLFLIVLCVLHAPRLKLWGGVAFPSTVRAGEIPSLVCLRLPGLRLAGSWPTGPGLSRAMRDGFTRLLPRRARSCRLVPTHSAVLICPSSAYTVSASASLL